MDEDTSIIILNTGGRTKRVEKDRLQKIMEASAEERGSCVTYFLAI